MIPIFAMTLDRQATADCSTMLVLKNTTQCLNVASKVTPTVLYAAQRRFRLESDRFHRSLPVTGVVWTVEVSTFWSDRWSGDEPDDPEPEEKTPLVRDNDCI